MKTNVPFRLRLPLMVSLSNHHPELAERSTAVPQPKEMRKNIQANIRRAVAPGVKGKALPKRSNFSTRVLVPSPLKGRKSAN